MSRNKTAFETVEAEYNMTGRSGTEQVFNSGRRSGVTPAEYKILESIHGRQNMRVIARDGEAMEFDGFDEKGVKQYRPRTEQEEIDRLNAWYGRAVFQKVFRDEYPELPLTFRDARIPVEIPDNVSKIKPRAGRDQQSRDIASAMEQGQGAE